MKRKTKKNIVPVIIIVTVAVIIAYIIFYPYITYFRYKSELTLLSETITKDNNVNFYNYSTTEYMDEQLGETSYLDKDVLHAVNSLFKNNSVTYIGWGCPLSDSKGNLYYCWDRLFVRISTRGEKIEYLVFSPDEPPDFQEYGNVKYCYICDNWYYWYYKKGSLYF